MIQHDTTFGGFEMNTKPCDIEDGHHYFKANNVHAWYLNGELHRIKGPAIIQSDGSEDWFRNGNRHRIDGPAVIRKAGHHVRGWMDADGNHRVVDGWMEWWIHGKIYTFDEYLQRLDAIDQSHATMMKLKWG